MRVNYKFLIANYESILNREYIVNFETLLMMIKFTLIDILILNIKIVIPH